MSFLAFLLKFAFFIFLIFLFIIGGIIYKFYKQFNRVKRQFNPYDTNRQTRRGDENTIIDNRPEDKKHKQVIPDSEGEYVDFTEVENK